MKITVTPDQKGLLLGLLELEVATQCNYVLKSVRKAARPGADAYEPDAIADVRYLARVVRLMEKLDGDEGSEFIAYRAQVARLMKG